jgi:acetyl esterase/lipase
LSSTHATLLLAQSIVAKNLPIPAAAWVISPMTRAEPLVFERHNAATADALCGDGAIKAFCDCIRRAGKPDELPYGDPSYSPYHASAAGLPPVFISWDADEVRAPTRELVVQLAFLLSLASLAGTCHVAQSTPQCLPACWPHIGFPSPPTFSKCDLPASPDSPHAQVMAVDSELLVEKLREANVPVATSVSVSGCCCVLALCLPRHGARRAIWHACLARHDWHPVARATSFGLLWPRPLGGMRRRTRLLTYRHPQALLAGT